ncbi:MAG: hypothetical protein HQK53_10300 [Oligoflexia bacterium]|nr:hypothetical protein [Oligoflexia bacterium]
MNINLAIAYCIEKSYEPYVISKVLDYIVELHLELKINCSLFVTGRALTTNRNDFLRLNKMPFLDIASHTFDHIGIKANLEQRKNEFNYIAPVSIKEIADDCRRFNSLYQEIFECQCLGFCAPRGFYRGLADRPDLLELLSSFYYKYIVSWTRNNLDWFPCDQSVAPFSYHYQGFSHLLEIPTHGWQDAAWIKTRPQTITTEYWSSQKNELLNSLKLPRKFFGLVLHDWVIFEEFIDNNLIKDFYLFCLENELSVGSFKDYYDSFYLNNQG